jgi:outer membrane protein TolC
LVAAAREEETARERAVAVAKGQFSPTVSASARYRLTDEPSTFFARDETFSYGARLTVPIFLGGLNISRVREARALHESAEHRVQAAERAAEAAARAAFERLIAARVAATAAREEIRATSVALEGVRVEASIGARTTLDVLNAVQESLNAEVSLAAAQREEGTAAFELLAATGELTME